MKTALCIGVVEAVTALALLAAPAAAEERNTKAAAGGSTEIKTETAAPPLASFDIVTLEVRLCDP